MKAFVLEDEMAGTVSAFEKLSEAQEEAQDCTGNYAILRMEIPVSRESILLLLSSSGGYATDIHTVFRGENPA